MFIKIKLYILLVLLGMVSLSGKTRQTEMKYLNLSGDDWFLWLDKDAEYQDDSLYLSNTPIEKIPSHIPTIGWENLFKEPLPWKKVQSKTYGKNEAIPPIEVSVPGTVEEYLWDANEGNYTGVSWWGKTIHIPENLKSKSVKLHFRQGARMRCEVYVNRQLMHYNLVSMLPFEADITESIEFGEENQIAIRITDATGNFGWADIRPHKWGHFAVPPSHGFGGIMGDVELEFHNNIRIEDIFVKNTPNIKDIAPEVTVRNTSNKPTKCTMEISVVEANKPDKILFYKEDHQTMVSGENKFSYHISVPNARIWDLNTPNLYHLRIEIKNKNDVRLDINSERFGFRWFEVSGQGKNAIFKLNNKRIVLRSAISWGYYPVNGMYATEEMARKHVESAKNLGLNMLNFHRGMGSETVLDAADELGILYFAEPGGYTSARRRGEYPFTRDWVTEKWLRMVKAMRNHPSLVIYNMINEQADAPDDRNHKDMADAHKLDPTRIKTYVSGWVTEGKTESMKLHMLPYDSTQYHYGWFDFHHARGWGSLQDLHYRNPETFFLNSTDKEEIVFYGEEGAIAVPPLLENAVNHYISTGKNGWDGKAYKAWLEAYNKYLDAKGWRHHYPSVDGLIKEMGKVSHYYQGRIIENIRISNTIDGYAVNGYECERNENHSGIVDVFRQPKTDKEILAYYNQPLYVALKARSKLQSVNSNGLIDAFIVNEKNLNGSYNLKLEVISPSGKISEITNDTVKISGGNKYGELLLKAIEVPFGVQPGRYYLRATLTDKQGNKRALGKEDFFVIDAKETIPGNGAVIDISGVSRQFLSPLPVFSDEMKSLDYIVVTQGDDEFSEIPARILSTPDGQKGMVKLEVFNNENFNDFNNELSVPRLRYDELTYPFKENLNLKPALSYRFSGLITPEYTGDYELEISHNWKTKLHINGKEILEGKNSVAGGKDGAEPLTYYFEAGKKYKINFESTKPFGRPLTHSAFRWKTPKKHYDVDELLDRVKEDGTTLIITHSAEEFLTALDQRKVTKYNGNLIHGHSWKGGIYFNKPHPIFNGLPQGSALNWEYQLFTRYFGPRHRSFILEKEEPLVASVTGHQHQIGTATGIINYGKGKILFTSFDIAPHLNSKEPAALTAKKILLNMLNFAVEN